MNAGRTADHITASLTDSALAARLILAARPRSGITPAERRAFMEEAARRLDAPRIAENLEQLRTSSPEVTP